MDGIAKKQTLKRIILCIHNYLHNRNLKGVVIGLSFLKGCNFYIHGSNSRVIIGDDCVLKGLNVVIYGDNTIVEIKDHTLIGASKKKPVVMSAFYGANIYIGEHCLLPDGTELHTTDYHSILDKDGNRTNPPASIYIGNHVWIGLRTVILKGSTIASNNVVGACSLVNKKFEEEYTIIAGNPARVVKRQINWDIKNIPCTIKP